jgi:sodium/hydrogen antiporter
VLDVVLAVTGALGLVVAALSGRLRRYPVSTAVLGLLAGVALGPVGLAAVDLGTVLDRHALLHEVARALLAVSVMGVALRFPLADVRRHLAPVALLVLVVMPLMALTSAAAAWWVLGSGLGAAVLLGVAVCPTDPVLATSAVTGEPAERVLPLRERLLVSLESGANDGLALPVVVVGIAVAAAVRSAGAGSADVAAAAGRSLLEVLGGAAVGALLGWLGGRALRVGERHGATETGPALLFTALLALAALGTAGLLGVADVLAVVVAGLVFNATADGLEREEAIPVDEALDRFGLLPVFLLLGVLLPWQAWWDLGWRGPVLAAAVLVLRRLPWVLLLRRPLGLSWAGAAYVGWFGPVGVSALLYLTLEAQRLGVDTTVLAAGVLVVVASTLLHAVTTPLGVRWYHRAAGRPAPSRHPAGSA